MNNGKTNLHLLFSDSHPILYKRHQVILRPEDTPAGVFYLRKGFVRLYTISEAGEELTLIIFKAGDFFPVMWAINNVPNNEYVEAMTDVEVRRVSRESFLEFLKQHPEVEFEVLSNILTRLDGMLERAKYLVFGNAYQKVASILVICGERFGEKRGNRILIKVVLTHCDIANLIGLTRETTSIEIKKLERDGFISHQGRCFLIKNMAKLQKEANWGDVITSGDK